MYPFTYFVFISGIGKGGKKEIWITPSDYADMSNDIGSHLALSLWYLR